MKIYVLLGVAAIEGHWKAKTLIDVFATRAEAERVMTELTGQLPPEVNADGTRNFWHDEEVYEYEIEERELIGLLSNDTEKKE